jgi:hypothetical protein
MVKKIAIGIILGAILYGVVVQIYSIWGKMPPRYLWLWLIVGFTVVWTVIWAELDKLFQERMRKRLDSQKPRARRR